MHPSVRPGPSAVPTYPSLCPGARSLSSTLSAPAHPQPADTAWKSLPWFPWKLGAKNHFQGHVCHSDKATLVHTNPQGRPVWRADPTPGREGSYSLRKEEQKTDCGRNQRDWLQRETSWSTSTSPERSPGPSLLLGVLTRPHLRGAGFGLCGSERQRPYLGSGDCSWRLCSPQPLTPDWELGLKPKRVEVPIHRSTKKLLS